ncbi:type VI secretion system Vgr family protein [Pseudomonas vanderleydeniana]|uniref:Type VI secretion system tip protein VgrG n=1 Tax=Pseudomonas vanderleydeniana TaxID=2745495 RepID=A0A9E6PP38_9PSED|nr:type VI secretion system tip protein TssI/VgrG [Pseudomonas vanderleydeniana]QXI30125.1 type VI secretion system tip protein VgrG [Pseudomonas vanderleydeniana]
MPRQSDLRFTFVPQQGDVLEVVSFELEEGLSRPFALTLELVSRDPAIDFNRILDLPALFTIWRHDTAVRHVHGLVSLFEQGDTGFRRTRYKAVVEPTLARAALRSNWRIFQGRTAPQIITEILETQPRTELHIHTYLDHQSREYCVQAGETDLDFITRLAAEEGLVYTFEHRSDGHCLLFACRIDSLGYIDTPENRQVPYQPMGGGDSSEPALRGFRYTEQVRSARQVQRDYTFKHPRYNLQHEADDGPALKNQHKDYERYDYPGRYKRDAAGKPFTANRLAALRNDARLAHLEGDDARLQPGLAFRLDDHPRDDLNGKWRSIALTHTGSQHCSLEEEAGDSQHGTRYRLEGSATLRNDGYDGWKASLPAKPRIDGPQVATVVGPPGEEIYCDEWGRVKVRFPWDRSDRADDHSSCWIRVSQGWAGSTWGAMAIPRVGQELIISYLDGDPDQPIATGRTYHVTQRPPYELPRYKARMTIKSRTHKGQGFNELRFEDEQGQQEVFIHAEKDKNVHVKNDNTTFVGNDRSEKVGNDERIDIGHDRHERVGHDERIDIVQDQHLEVGRDRIQAFARDHRSQVGRDRIEDVGNDRHDRIAADHHSQTAGSAAHHIGRHYRLRAGQSIKQDTALFEVAAGQRIVLKAPGGSITLDAQGITLDGLAINIRGPLSEQPVGSGNPLGSLLSPADKDSDSEEEFLGRYTLLKNDQRAFAGYRYSIVQGSTVLVEGLTGASGETDWTTSATSQSVQAHKAIMREDQQISENWRPRISTMDDPPLPPESGEMFPDDFLDQQIGEFD